MFFNYDNLEDGSQQPNAWYYPRRHDYFTYNTETTGEWPEYPSMTCTGENPEFFTKPGAYTPEEENNSNYAFKYPEVRFNCVEGKNRKTSWIPNGFPPTLGDVTQPDGYYSGMANGSQITAITPVVATCPEHYGAYVGKTSTFFTGTNFQKTIVLEVTRVGEEPDDTCLLRIAAAPQNVSPSPSSDPDQYTTELNDPILAPDMDIKFPWFFPEIESSDVSVEGPPYDSTYLEWIRDNCIMYTFTQDGIAGISAVTLQGHDTASRRQYRAVTWSENTPSKDTTRRTSPWNNVERITGNDSLAQLGILEDYIASEPSFGTDFADTGIIAVSGDSGRPKFLHIPEITGTSPILVGQVGTEGIRGFSNTMYLDLWDATVLSYHTTAGVNIYETIAYYQRWIGKSQLYELDQWSDTTPSSYGGGGTKDPFQGEILQWLPLPDGRWDLSGLKITTSYDDEPHDGPDNAWSPVPVLPTYEGWNLRWNTDDNLFHSVSDMIDEVPTFTWETEKFWLVDFKDVEESQWWPPLETTWLTRPSHWYNLQSPGIWDEWDDDSGYPWFNNVFERSGTKFTWIGETQKWGPRKYYTWRHQNWYSGSATITDDTDPGFTDGKVDYEMQDYWCDYKFRSGLIPVWDDTLYQKNQDPETEDPHGCFILEPPLHREVLLNADKEALERPDPWDEDGDPFAYAPVLGWLDGALRLIKPSLGDIGTVLITGTPRSGTVLRWDTAAVWDPEEDPGAWVPNRYANGEEAWARDTYSVDMTYNTLFQHNVPGGFEGTKSIGDNMSRDIFIPNTCTWTGYKIFDFAALIHKRQESNPYLEPGFNTTNNPATHGDHVSHAWMPCSAIPPVGHEAPTDGWCTFNGSTEFVHNWKRMEYYAWPPVNGGDLGHYICQDMFADPLYLRHLQILYSMKLNIYHIRPYWGDQDPLQDWETDHPGTVTTIATGVAYDDNINQEWRPVNVELLKGDLIRIELDTSYQEAPSYGDYPPDPQNNCLQTNGELFSHPSGLSHEYGNWGDAITDYAWPATTAASQSIAKTSFHIKLANLEGVL